jgi:subtilisin family serine protease
MRFGFRGVLLCSGLLVAAVPALADISKLDPIARIAMQRLMGGESAQSLRDDGRVSVSVQGDLDVFVVGDVSRAQLEAAGARVRTALPGVFTAWIPVDRVDDVAAIAGVQRIEGAAIDEITNDLGSASTGVNLYRGAGPAFTGLNGAGVIVGGVDTGVDYDHEDFKDALGNTRILKIWDQTNAVGPAPGGFGYGTEWNSAQINALISTAGDTHGHGSHTMGSAAGDGSKVGTAGSAPAYQYTGMAPMADIIVVDGSVSGSFSRAQMTDAANYIFQQAALFGKPAVVNMSIGSQFGPKDGTDPFELAVDAMSGPGRIVVMSSGNDRNAPLHAEWVVGNPAVTMNLGSTSATPRFTAINGYYEASEQLNVSITTPGGTVVGPITLGNMSAAYPGVPTANGNVYLENGVALTATGDRQVYIELNAPNGATISGTWTITFTPVVIGPANGEVDLFRFSTNLTTSSFVSGNQPTEEIVSAIATGINTVAAGAWVTRQAWTDCRAANWNDPTTTQFGGAVPIGNIANFSSPGPTRDGRLKPDVAAPGTAIASSRSTDTPLPNCTVATVGLPGGAHIINQGTSMAAPHVTGAIALLYQKYGNLTPPQVQTLLHTRAMVDGFVTAFGAVPNKDFGWGKLHLGDMADPTVTVTAPNGGEIFAVGQPLTYQWAASDNMSMGSIDLYLSRDGGTSYTLVAAGVPNTGSYNTTATGPPSNACKLKVVATDASSNVGTDASDQDWAIIDGPTGTLLSMLAAEPSESGISVRWQFADPSAFAAVSVERSDAADGIYVLLGSPQGGTDGVATFVDREVESGRTYWYRIVGQTATGSRSTFGPISAVAGQAVMELALARVAPNPTTSQARVDFALPTAGHVNLTVHDVQGREIARLADGTFAAGRFQATWNGRSERGTAPAGLYFVRLQALGRTLTQRLVVSR